MSRPITTNASKLEERRIEQQCRAIASMFLTLLHDSLNSTKESWFTCHELDECLSPSPEAYPTKLDRIIKIVKNFNVTLDDNTLGKIKEILKDDKNKRLVNTILERIRIPSQAEDDSSDEAITIGTILDKIENKSLNQLTHLQIQTQIWLFKKLIKKTISETDKEGLVEYKTLIDERWKHMAASLKKHEFHSGLRRLREAGSAHAATQSEAVFSALTVEHDAARNELIELTRAFEHTELRAETAEEALRALTEERDDARNALSEAHDRATSAVEALRALTEERDAARGELTALTIALSEANDRATRAEEATRALTVELDDAVEERDDARNEHDDEDTDGHDTHMAELIELQASLGAHSELTQLMLTTCNQQELRDHINELEGAIQTLTDLDPAENALVRECQETINNLETLLVSPLDILLPTDEVDDENFNLLSIALSARSNRRSHLIEESETRTSAAKDLINTLHWRHMASEYRRVTGLKIIKQAAGQHRPERKENRTEYSSLIKLGAGLTLAGLGLWMLSKQRSNAATSIAPSIASTATAATAAVAKRTTSLKPNPASSEDPSSMLRLMTNLWNVAKNNPGSATALAILSGAALFGGRRSSLPRILTLPKGLGFRK